MDMRTSAPYRPLGGWLEAPPPDNDAPPLQQDLRADVVVVGAGFAGLCTALELAARGAEVVVLERETAGFGASGRNAGYLAGALGIEYELFLRRVGHDAGRQIVRFYEEGVDYVERILATHGIDCDYTASGLVRAGVHAAQERKLRKDRATGETLGFHCQWLDGAAMRRRGIPPAFRFGCYTPRGGTLDPGKYVLGLRQAALRAGVRLHERTAVQSWSTGPVCEVRTARGTVRAPHLVLATNAYTPRLGLLADKVQPIRVSALETEPLNADQRTALGWPGREGVVTAHWTMESHRLTARNTLLVTTKRLHYSYGSRTPHEPDEAAYRALSQALRDRFPQLAGIGTRACWSGWVSLAADALPVVGEAGAQGNVHYAAGCSGHGLGTQSLIGRLLCERIAGGEPALLKALRHKTPRTLPEPLRWCALRGVLGVANLLDARVDRQARRALPYDFEQSLTSDTADLR